MRIFFFFLKCCISCKPEGTCLVPRAKRKEFSNGKGKKKTQQRLKMSWGPERRVRKKDLRDAAGQDELVGSSWLIAPLLSNQREDLHQRLTSFSTTRDPAAILPGNYI